MSKRRIERYLNAPMAAMMGIGRASLTDARLWLRHPGAVFGTLRLSRRDGEGRAQTRSVSLEPAPERDGTHTLQLAELGFVLVADTTYELHLETPDHSLSCRFQTALSPEHRGRICFAVGSCHNPFQSDGYDHAPSMAFLRSLPDALEAHGARHVFLVGDQVYSDLPTTTSLFDDDVCRTLLPDGIDSLFDASRAQVRAMYQQRHRAHWKHPEWQALQAAAVTTMLLDDHDIVDNFGTAPEHATARWESIRQGALDAYHDYQASRFLEGPRRSHAGSVVDLGRVRVVQVDIRSERRFADGQVRVLDEGVAHLDQALASSTDATVLCIVLPVPVAHWPSWLVDGVRMLEGDDGDAADRWSSAPMRPARDRLLQRLRAHQADHPGQRMILLSGDTHIGAIGAIAWSDETPDLLQLVSSALTNEQSAMVKIAARTAPHIRHSLVRDGDSEPYAQSLLLPDVEGTNPYGQLNLGFVEVEEQDGRDRVRLSLVGSHLSAPGWRTVCRTGWL